MYNFNIYYIVYSNINNCISSKNIYIMYFDILDIYDINKYGIFRIILVGRFGDLVV